MSPPDDCGRSFLRNDEYLSGTDCCTKHCTVGGSTGDAGVLFKDSANASGSSPSPDVSAISPLVDVVGVRTMCSSVAGSARAVCLSVCGRSCLLVCCHPLIATDGNGGLLSSIDLPLIDDRCLDRLRSRSFTFVTIVAIASVDCDQHTS